MVYIRFQSPTPNRRGAHIGIFGLTNTLAHRGALTPDQHATWRTSNDWYNVAYPDPTANDPTVYDRELHPLAAAWFKASAVQLLERIPLYLQILATHGVACERVETSDPGRVIYEDDSQVVVVPRQPHAGSPAPLLGHPVSHSPVTEHRAVDLVLDGLEEQPLLKTATPET